MVRNEEGALAPKPRAMESMIRDNIVMNDQKYSEFRFRCTRDLNEPNEGDEESLLPLVLPPVPDHKRVIYTIYEYDPLLDSSNMTMDDWIRISRDIKHSYQLFDGFVVLHGTDTLAYTASALSFMLEHLGKPVIITGSQIPCFETRSDGRDNFVGALILAGNYNIPEVTVYFRHQLMRGNRTIKVSSGDLNAFQSPNMAPLVRAGIDIVVNHRAIHRPKSLAKFSVHTSLNRNVVLLRLFPSIRPETVEHFMKPPIEGVVLQCYGAGNMPSNREDIMRSIQEATSRGVLIVSVTQCSHGGVSGLYETGKKLLDAGVIPGADITPEAALAKLSYVLSKKTSSYEERRRLMMTNLAGEITILNPAANETQSSEGELELIKAVAKQLRLKTSEEIKTVEEFVFPALLCAAAHKGGVETLKAMVGLGADLASSDYDLRTPLHVAASDGDAELVSFLLSQAGASVHARDRSNHSPLRCAIDAGHEDVIRVLVQCGAHLQLSQADLAEELCFRARKGDVQGLKCYRLAGANLNSTNLTRSTPLHMAVETGQIEVVELLLASGVNQTVQNVYGQTPTAIATVLRRVKILEMLKEASTDHVI